MPGSDYAAWVARAQAFIHDLGRSAEAKVHSSASTPPASDEDVAAVERALGATLVLYARRRGLGLQVHL